VELAITWLLREATTSKRRLPEKLFPILGLVFPILLSMLFAPFRRVIVAPLAFFRRIIAKLLVIETRIEPCSTV